MFPSITENHTGPEVTKQPQTIALPPPCLTVGMMFFYFQCCVTFTTDVKRHTSSKKFNFALPIEYSPKSIGNDSGVFFVLFIYLFFIFFDQVHRAFTFFEGGD